MTQSKGRKKARLGRNSKLPFAKPQAQRPAQAHPRSAIVLRSASPELSTLGGAAFVLVPRGCARTQTVAIVIKQRDHDAMYSHN